MKTLMKHAQPRDVSRRRVEQLLSKTRSNGSAGARIEFFSRHFLGRPYTINPLIGSADMPEVFTASLDGFDCVTYVETVLALSCSSSVDEFTDFLRKIRYEEGRVEWKRRNHYMTGWIRNNTRIGTIRRLPTAIRPVVKERILDVVRGVPPIRTRFECVPKSFIRPLGAQLETGDLIFFASTRKHLDVFHCGILVRDRDRLKMRHASRSRKGVVEQDLDEFLKANRMAGLIVVRPTEERALENRLSRGSILGRHPQTHR
jgi:hypothetical protein